LKFAGRKLVRFSFLKREIGKVCRAWIHELEEVFSKPATPIIGKW